MTNFKNISMLPEGEIKSIDVKISETVFNREYSNLKKMGMRE